MGTTQTRTVKFNIKDFIESYVFLHESKDKEGKAKLMSEIDNYVKTCSPKVRDNIMLFIKNNKVSKQYAELQAYAMLAML